MFNGAELLGKMFDGGLAGAGYDKGALKGQGSGYGGSPAGSSGGLFGGLASLFGGGAAQPASPSFGASGGGLALMGSLAYAAWRAYSNRSSGPAAPAPATQRVAMAPPPNNEFAPPQDATGQHVLGTLLVRAMISAAKADGQIDAQETQRIFGEMNTQHLSQAEKAFLMEEIGKPIDVDALTREVRTPQDAIQVYAASAMVIDSQTPQEVQYLQTLAQKLRLDGALVSQIHQQLQGSRQPPGSAQPGSGATMPGTGNGQPGSSGGQQNNAQPALTGTGGSGTGGAITGTGGAGSGSGGPAG
jgi:uncharacterized membrane protein YebE (DUF533 family)